MIDTEREKTETFEYQHRYVVPALASAGVAMHIVRKSQYATVDLTSKNGRNILIPAFTNISGEKGKLSTYCSGEWKHRVINRFLREQGVGDNDRWLGYSLDEMRRVSKDDTKRERKLYPLIDLRKSRGQCIAAVLNFGWPKPPRSACWMCPNQCDLEWREMKEKRPDDFAMAVAFERMLRKDDPNLFLHESCVPLDEVDFSIPFVSAFESGCQSGLCFV
jgi:hypothetical protein